MEGYRWGNESFVKKKDDKEGKTIIGVVKQSRGSFRPGGGKK